jgi:hypothetical protein
LLSITGQLVVLYVSEFKKNVRWLEKNLDFNVDVRLNAFECNIRVLGGLLSAHVLAEGNGVAGAGAGPSGGAGKSNSNSGGKRKGSRGGGGSGSGGGRNGGGGTLSGSHFARDGGVGLSMGPAIMPSYKGGLLRHARDLGGGLYKLRIQLTHSLKPPGVNL